MCGIAAALSRQTIDDQAMTGMCDALRQRGPDARGIYVSDSAHVGLAHTRLSIIDLRPESNQPFFSSDGRYAIVFNGEIYNFQSIRNELTAAHGVSFRTRSDTEVIIEAFATWGPAMVNKLHGMFAFVILDKQTETLYIFRDRVGKKPLYYFLSDSLFACASEIKSLLRHPAIKAQVKVNRDAIGAFLHLGYIPEPMSIYNNVFKFPAGHRGVIDKRLQLQTEAYWKIDNMLKPTPAPDEVEAKNRLHDLLTNAVKERLISDVPLGTFLSGGTDSSLISAIASTLVSGPLRTYSIGFKDSKHDESQYAQQVSRQLGTEHTGYMLEEKEAIDLLESYLRYFDEPFADTSAIPTMLVSRLARREVTVALTGDGGDELFQGYGAYTWARRLDTAAWKLGRAPIRMALHASGKSRLQRVAHLLDAVPSQGLRSHIFSQEQYLFSQREIAELLRNPEGINPIAYNERRPQTQHLNAAEQQALFDFQYYLKDDLLVKVDRASMYYGLECRCPLLDHTVVEYAFTLPYKLKVREGKSKWLLKELLKTYIPPALVDRPKWGFSVPLGSWLKNELRFLIDDYLNDTVIDEVGLFRKELIARWKAEFFAGRDYLYNRLWVIIVLHKWWKENQ